MTGGPSGSSTFTPEARTRVRERVLEVARTDDRITGGAVTGSRAVGREDRWSDIDLSFGVRDGVDPRSVLDAWTERLSPELDVIHHWDLIRAATIYRVFLLPGGLELDIAVTRAAHFGAHGPKFHLEFGRSSDQPSEQTSFDEDVGYGWLYALNARAAIERGRPWAAEYWISALRDQALSLACSRVGEAADYARGIDRLPGHVVAPYEQTLLGSLSGSELRPAMDVAIELFLGEVAAVQPPLAERLRPAIVTTP
jgi:hypothetical protein